MAMRNRIESEITDTCTYEMKSRAFNWDSLQSYDIYVDLVISITYYLNWDMYVPLCIQGRRIRLFRKLDQSNLTSP